MNHSEIVSFLWGVADLIRDTFKRVLRIHNIGTQAQHKGSLNGHIDVVDRFHVVGWAAYPGGVAPTLSIKVEGKTIGTVIPKYARPDLASLYGSNTNLGFQYSFHSAIPAGSLLSISDELGQKLANSPQRVADDPTLQMVAEAAAGLSTPIPDEHLIFLVNGHWSKYEFAKSRRPAVGAIIELLDNVKVDYRNFNTILDFGCGCGRILAGWESLLPAGTKLLGCDINADLIAFCQANIPFAQTWVSGYLPPLKDVADAAVDLVYSASVFTHLTESAAQDWASELCRILRPGGILFMSYSDSHTEGLIGNFFPDVVRQFRETGFHCLTHGTPKETWLGSNDYATYMDLAFIDRTFKGFERIGVRKGTSGPTSFASVQDIVVLRKIG